MQDVTEGSPGERAGSRPYDVIVSVDGTRVRTNDDLIRHIAARPPGMGTTLQVLRDGRELSVALRLGARPSVGEEEGARPAPARGRSKDSISLRARPSAASGWRPALTSMDKGCALLRGRHGVPLRVMPMTLRRSYP